MIVQFIETPGALAKSEPHINEPRLLGEPDLPDEPRLDDAGVRVRRTALRGNLAPAMPEK